MSKRGGRGRVGDSGRKDLCECGSEDAAALKGFSSAKRWRARLMRAGHSCVLVAVASLMLGFAVQAMGESVDGKRDDGDADSASSGYAEFSGSYAGSLWRSVRESSFVGDGSAAAEDDVWSDLGRMGFHISKDDGDGARVDECIKEEVIDLGEYSEWIASPDWEILCIIEDGDRQRIEERIAKELTDKGWTFTDKASGESDSKTMVKTKGECRWMMISFAQIKDATSAVLRIQRA